MDLTPQSIAQATFGVTRKGYEPDEVRRFLADVARALDAAQQQSSAMEVRARTALAKLQEASQQTPSSEQTEAISRTLLLAQRAADDARAQAAAEAEAVIAEATAAAAELRSAAEREATTMLDEARSFAERMVESARTDARRARDEEYLAAESAVQALLARREFLLADVESLEQHVETHRERLREVSVVLADLADRGADGLSPLRRPVLSAADAPSTLDALATGAGTARQAEVLFEVDEMAASAD